MIGAVVFELAAENGGQIPEAQGRLLHGAFFALMKETDPALASSLHDDMVVKPFSIAPLELSKRASKTGEGRWVQKGRYVYWRVAALNEAVFRALLAIPKKSVMRVGRLRLKLRRVIADSDKRPDVGVLDEMDLIAACLSVPFVKTVELRFLTPVAFRVNEDDYPLPVPALVFSSLADRWTAVRLPGVIDRKEIRAAAERVRLQSWQGETRRVFFGRSRSVTGFVGTFVFDLSALPADAQRVFLLLAQFAVFSGVGRLTSQGLGQTRTTYQ